MSNDAQTLHLIEPPRASGSGRESSLFAWSEMSRLGRVEPGPVMMLGDSMSARWANAHSITPDARLTPPCGRPALLWSALRREIRRRRPDEIRCWSAPALRLCAALPGIGGIPIHATLVEGPEANESVLSRRAARVRSIETFDDEDANAWRSLGFEANAVELGPVIESASPDRGALQRAIGVSESQVLLGTLFDHPSDTDARRLSFLLAILAVSEHDAVGIVPSGARLIEAGRRYARVINREYRLLLSGRPLIEQLRAFDACVTPDPTRAPARGSARLLRRAAEAAGVRAFNRPEYSGISGPTPPEMIRPMLDVLEGAA